MASVFKQIENYINDISIVNRKVAVCYRNQEPTFLKGNVLEIIFDSQCWNTTIIYEEAKGKIIYSVIINHLLFKKLQLLAEMNKIKQIHTQDVTI